MEGTSRNGPKTCSLEERGGEPDSCLIVKGSPVFCTNSYGIRRINVTKRPIPVNACLRYFSLSGGSASVLTELASISLDEFQRMQP